MTHDSDSTRRTFLKGTAAAALGTGGLAGCVSDSDSQGEPGDDTPTDVYADSRA